MVSPNDRISTLKSLLHAMEKDTKSLQFDFDQRLRVQKIVYLLRLHPRFSSLLPYSFNMYLRGPYSPDLARVYYGDLEGAKMTELNLGESERRYMRFVSSLDSSKLELLATVIEALHHNPKKNEATIIEVVRSLKPYFTKEQVSEAIKQIRSLKTEYHLDF